MLSQTSKRKAQEDRFRIVADAKGEIEIGFLVPRKLDLEARERGGVEIAANHGADLLGHQVPAIFAPGVRAARGFPSLQSAWTRVQQIAGIPTMYAPQNSAVDVQRTKSRRIDHGLLPRDLEQRAEQRIPSRQFEAVFTLRLLGLATHWKTDRPHLVERQP